MYMEQAEREGYHRAIVGGVDFAIGGWGEYEVDRRRARWTVDPIRGGARERYPDRSYVGSEDVAISILMGSRAIVGGGQARCALRLAALNLAEALGRLEDRFCDPDDDGVWECSPVETGVRAKLDNAAKHLTVPSITSADLRSFAEDPAQWADPDAMYELLDAVVSLAEGADVTVPALPPFARRADLPPLPPHIVLVTDDEGVLELETKVLPYVASLEGLQAALATRLDTAANRLNSFANRMHDARAVRRHPRTN